MTVLSCILTGSVKKRLDMSLSAADTRLKQATRGKSMAVPARRPAGILAEDDIVVDPVETHVNPSVLAIESSPVPVPPTLRSAIKRASSPAVCFCAQSRLDTLRAADDVGLFVLCNSPKPLQLGQRRSCYRQCPQ